MRVCVIVFYFISNNILFGEINLFLNTTSLANILNNFIKIHTINYNIYNIL